MKIHAKMLIPLSLGILLLGAYLVVFWLPLVLDENHRQHRKLVNFQLAALGETLVAPLQLNDINQIHSVLNKSLFRNTRFSEITLTDPYGNVLFSNRALSDEGEGSDERYEHVISYSGEPLGTLSVRARPGEGTGALESSLATQLLGGMLLASLLYLTAIGGMTEFAIRRPVARLTRAARRLEKGEYDTPLPAASGDEVGELTGAFVSMQAALKESFETWKHYENAVDSHCLISIADAEQRIVYTNERYQEISGYASHELTGRNIWELMGLCRQCDKDTGYENCRDIRHRLPWSGETEFINRYGRVYWTKSSIVPVMNDSEQPDKYIHIQTDITAQRLSEEIARKRGDRLAQLIDSGPCMLYRRAGGVGYPVTYISGNVKDILGFDSGEIENDDSFWGRRIHPEDRGAPEIPGDGTVREGHVYVAEYRFRSRDGSYVRLRDQYSVVTDTAGNVVEIAGSLTPQTDAGEHDVSTAS